MFSSYSFTKFNLSQDEFCPLLTSSLLPWWLSGKENHLPMQEMQIQSLGQEYPLEKEMATHSSILVWEIPWTEELWGCKRVRCDLVTKQQDKFSALKILP